MGLKGRAAVTGVADYKNVRKYTGERKFFLEQWAELTQLALADAGLSKHDVDGLCCEAIPESSMFAPAIIAEYLGLQVNFGSFPVKTHGGQLGAGQAAGIAGGMSQPVEGVRQIMGRADGRQIANCNNATTAAPGRRLRVPAPFTVTQWHADPLHH